MKMPRLMIAATGSGVGKTTVVSAILQAFADRGLKLASFKCGPDYIDPMFHEKAIGTKSRNLDLYFFGSSTAIYLLCRNSHGADLSLLEGVMGYYDGIGETDFSSSYHLARETKTPVILVINCKGKSLSNAAIVNGFLKFREDSNICGLILNGIKSAQYEPLKSMIVKETGLPVMGYLPYLEECRLESRHLGLVTPEELGQLQKLLHRLAQQAEKTICLDALLDLAGTAPELYPTEPELPEHCSESVRIAIARDRAFCFYYEDSLQLLRDLGAELVEFSPLSDKSLPGGCCGLYLGGGYPELYACQLSENAGMRKSVFDAIQNGMPCIAECGGFLYLSESLESPEGSVYPMVGIIDSDSRKTDSLNHFGYVELTAERDNLLCRRGESIRAHEFHYWQSSDNGNSFTAKKPFRDASWDCVHTSDTLYAGYPHFHFYSNPAFAKNFLMKCEKYGRKANG